MDGVNPLSSAQPYLSIVIPAHNEEHRLPPSLAKIDAYLTQQPYTYEVLVVENGSSDRTSAVTLEFAKSHPYVRLLEVQTRGKGLAVKAGMLEARGQYRFICDTDLSMPIEEIEKFLPPHYDGYEVMIGTREGKGAKRIGEPEYRHVMGRILNWIVKLTAVPDFEDTQCGFKMFKGNVADDLFQVQLMNGIGFDVELIFLAKKRGYRITDVPITWYYDPDSRMKLLQDSLHILVEIWQVHRNWREGRYEKRQP